MLWSSLLLYCCLSVLLLLLASAVKTTSKESQQLSAEVCLDYGYNSNVLVCSTCEAIGQILGDQSEAKLTCQRCCVADNKPEDKYQKIILEVDKRSVTFLPDIEKVIKDKKKLKLTVRYRMGPAVLSMYKNKDDDEPTETISVQSWTKDVFEEYLSTHLATSK